MAVRTLIAVACAVAAVGARAPESRFVDSDALPNNMFDTLVSGLVYHFTRTGQGESRALPEKTAQIPYATDEGDKFITIKMSGELKNFKQIRRSGTANLNNNDNTLRGTISIDDAEISANYVGSFPAVGVAPANTASGTTSMKGQVFCDMNILVDQEGKPVSLQSANGRVGWHKYGGATGLNGNQYGPTYESAFQDSLRTLMRDMCEKTVRLIAQNQVLPDIGVE